RLEKRSGVVGDVPSQAESEGQFARLIRLQTNGRMYNFFDNRLGIRLSDFFDFHATRGAGHENDAADTAIHEQRKVKFALDVEPFFNKQTFYDATSRARLNRDKIHAEHVSGNVGGFIRRMNELDATRLAAAAGVNLRLDDDHVRFEALRPFAGFFFGESDFAARRCDSVARKNRLCLIFVDLHSRCSVLDVTAERSTVKILLSRET